MEARRLKSCIAGLVLVAVALFLLGSIASYDAGEGAFPDSPPNVGVRNICGAAGAHVAGYALATLGWVAVAVGLGLGLAGAVLVTGVRLPYHPGILSAGVLTGFLALMIGLSLHTATMPGDGAVYWRLGDPSSGTAGMLLTQWLYGRIGWAGTLTALLLLASVSVLLLAGSRVAWLGAGIKGAAAWAAAGLKAVARRVLARTRFEMPQVQPAATSPEPWVNPPVDEHDAEAGLEALTIPEEEIGPEQADELEGGSEDEAQPSPDEGDDQSLPEELIAEPEPVPPEMESAESAGGAVQGALWRNEVEGEDEDIRYELPPIELLDTFEAAEVAGDSEDVRRRSQVLERTLREFKIEARVVGHRRGPVITMFELALSAGTKVSRVESLSNDLAIALKAPNVRIVAPLPGRSTVGIELPNARREVVGLREMLGSAGQKAARMAIPLMMGKDTAGTPLIVDLAAAPHLLLAGATGSGKSVAMNSIICSILMTRTPHEVQMLLIDPKSVEFSDYRALPHLICPILIDMKKAAAVLQWACKKMDERYALLARTSVRDLASYNKLGRQGILDRLNPEEDASVDDVPFYMPHIVIVIDELGELMMVAAKEVESSVIRLSQKARAVGIHLICATQRPSVDVITGLIKANLPGRIAFQVSSKVDSRTILDRNGAELLLGKGDMLMLPPGTSRLVRAQGTFMTGQEVGRIVEFWTEQSGPQFKTELREYQAAATDEESGDGLYEDAVRIVLETQRGSVSLLQRRLSIGYSRAARLVDMMAEAGIVGTYKGSQAREVVMTVDEWETARTAK
ncbi:MAG: DNA translocase FtsK 4TM domain-containing protein [Candidatus Brocadiia bacterium]|jgi:S-DNA-T family DNA segregation ATPase FtsK/SpoIIIE|nr:DNA translocase FtsK 4TM domain-containing protein [Candidatus Brocadiia bacterium]